jgi:hypothetical protein
MFVAVATASLTDTWSELHRVADLIYVVLRHLNVSQEIGVCERVGNRKRDVRELDHRALEGRQCKVTLTWFTHMVRIHLNS